MKTELLPIQTQIWQDKYRFVAPAGLPRLTSDECVEDTWQRVARALAAPEGHESRMWEKRFFSALESFKFLPAGRIIAGAGTNRDVTLFNCYVLGTIPDSMDGIFTRLREAALTQQQGGGVGTDFSTLRPFGADVRGVAAKSSGPVSFMDVWDAMCKTIMSAGARRGAMMATLRCDHPDIELFIDAKRDPARLRNFNVSVLVTDAFMNAVKGGLSWDLKFDSKVYKTVSALHLWTKIMRSAYETAEPGVIFIDRINDTNNLKYCETIYSTNPCAEQPLPPNGACLLGSINLAAFIREPFLDRVYFDEVEVVRTTKIAVRMMDNVIDVSGYPLPEQQAEAQAKRRIGLGITGLADALAMCGLHYGAPEACKTAALWMKMINAAAYQASMELAEEKGKFPLWSEKMGCSYYPERGSKPIRNGLVTSIAPTGTISLLAGNISSGIEPMYDWYYTRNIKQPDDSMLPVKVEDYAVGLYHKMFPGEELPPQFHACAHDLSPKQHLAMQEALQPHVDASISKTVNCPRDMPFEDFEALYLDAYASGLKVCSAFRPNDVTGSILQPDEPIQNKRAPYDWKEGPAIEKFAGSVSNTGPIETVWTNPGGKKEIMDLIHEASGVSVTKAADIKPGTVLQMQIVPRPQRMKGFTYKVKWNAHALYITINDDEFGHPYEIFINSKHPEHYAGTVALTRMISAIWRRGGDTSFVTEELKAIHDPRGGAWLNGKYVPSVQAAIGIVIDEHIAGRDLGMELRPETQEFRPDYIRTPEARFCPACSSTNVWFPKANCLTCRDCSFSNCE